MSFCLACHSLSQWTVTMAQPDSSSALTFSQPNESLVLNLASFKFLGHEGNCVLFQNLTWMAHSLFFSESSWSKVPLSAFLSAFWEFCFLLEWLVTSCLQHSQVSLALTSRLFLILSTNLSPTLRSTRSVYLTLWIQFSVPFPIVMNRVSIPIPNRRNRIVAR